MCGFYKIAVIHGLRGVELNLERYGMKLLGGDNSE